MLRYGAPPFVEASPLVLAPLAVIVKKEEKFDENSNTRGKLK